MSRGPGPRPEKRPGPLAAVLRTQLAGALARPGRLLMTGLSVLVAAFVVFGTVMAQQITEQTTVDRFRGTPEAADLVVLGDDDVITDAQLKAVQAVPGVAEVATRTENGVSLAEVSRRYLELQGDPGSGPLSRVRLVAGGYPDGPLELAVNRQAAQRLDIEPGERVGLLVPVGGDAEETDGTDGTDETRTVDVTVTGVVEANSDREATGYAPAAALNAMGHIEGYPRIDVRAEPGVSAEALTERLSAVFQRTPGAAFEFAPGDTVRAEEARAAVDQYADVFRLIAMFLAIAVVAAALVATSTFRVVFAQRLRQLALLRTIGAHRGQLVRALAVEGALVGLIAGTAGVLLALGAGYAAPVIAHAAGLSLSAPAVPVAAAVAVVLGAVLVTVGAVLAPASSAAGVSPLQTLRSAGTLAGERGIGLPRLVVGLLLAVGAVGLAGVLLGDLPEPGDLNYDSVAGLMLTVLSGTLAFLALITLGPLLVRPLLAIAGWPLRRLGPTGTLAVGGIGGARVARRPCRSSSRSASPWSPAPSSASRPCRAIWTGNWPPRPPRTSM